MKVYIVWDESIDDIAKIFDSREKAEDYINEQVEYLSDAEREDYNIEEKIVH